LRSIGANPSLAPVAWIDGQQQGTTEIDPMMSLVRLLGFKNLSCGCVTGHYRELGTNREITYVEEKGTACDHQEHRRNHTLATARFRMPAVTAKAS